MEINLTRDWDWDGWMDDEEDDGDGSSIFDFFCAAASLSPPLGQLSSSFSLILSRSFFRFFLLSPSNPAPVRMYWYYSYEVLLTTSRCPDHHSWSSQQLDAFFQPSPSLLLAFSCLGHGIFPEYWCYSIRDRQSSTQRAIAYFASSTCFQKEKKK